MKLTELQSRRNQICPLKNESGSVRIDTFPCRHAKKARHLFGGISKFLSFTLWRAHNMHRSRPSQSRIKLLCAPEPKSYAAMLNFSKLLWLGFHAVCSPLVKQAALYHTCVYVICREKFIHRLHTAYFAIKYSPLAPLVSRFIYADGPALCELLEPYSHLPVNRASLKYTRILIWIWRWNSTGACIHFGGAHVGGGARRTLGSLSPLSLFLS